MKISQFALANFVFYSIIDKGGSKMKKICNLLIALVLLFVPIVCLADSDKKAANVYIFYGKGCPHCEEFFTWVKSLFVYIVSGLYSIPIFSKYFFVILIF